MCVVVYKHNNSVVNIVVTRLVFGKVSYLALVSYFPFIISQECLCCCLQVNYIVYKYFDRSLHVRSSDPTCVQYFKSVPLTVLRYWDSN